MNAISIDSPHPNNLAVSPDRVIEFPDGLPGFEQLRRFSIFQPESEAEGHPKYFILQSLDDPSVAFNIADPALFGFNYEINLSDAEIEALSLADASEAVVVVMLVKEDGRASGESMRANLKAPLVLNTSARRGIQHVFSRLNYQVTITSSE